MVWALLWQRKCLLFFRGVRVRLVGAKGLHLSSLVAIGDSAVLDGRCLRGIHISANATIGHGARLLGSGVIGQPGEGIWIGAHTAIGAGNTIWGQGGVHIGSDCLLGPDVVIVSENHGHTDPSQLIRLQAPRRAPITIDNNVWVGAQCVITAGTHIGEGAVVAAGAVVTRDVAPYSVVGGVPAAVIGQRDRQSK